MEVDNVFQEIFFPEEGVFSYSLYYPYVYISSTRNCLSSLCDLNLPLTRERKLCHLECKKYTFTLGHPILEEKFFIREMLTFI